DYQNAADSAVLAGSAFLSRPISTTKRVQARQAAWESLKSQLGLSVAIVPATLAASNTAAGTPILDSGYRMWVSTPPIQATTKYPGSFTGSTARYLFALVEKDNPTFFARVFGQGNATVGAWATAGSFPSRFAVITLRQNGQGPVSAPSDIDLDGNNTVLEVIDGDVGGNWGMKLTASAQLWLRGYTDNDAEAYLVDYVSCGNSCWSPTQVSSGPNGSPANELKPPLQLPGIIEDPSYSLPSVLAGAPTAPVPGTVAVPGVPIGDLAGNVDVRSGGPSAAPGGASVVSGVLTCDPASPRIGPGYYTNISIAQGKCLILDPTVRHTSVRGNVVDVPSNVAQTQLPGIFYVNGDIDVNTNAMIVGDGVTVIMRPATSNPGNQLTVSGGGVVDLNRGSPGISAAQKLGAWMRSEAQPYAWNAGQWVYQSSLEAANLNNVGIALYVIKREQFSIVAADDSSEVIKINAGAALAWDGITYAPHDNITLSGQPGHDAIGQFISWTFKFAGGVHVAQTYAGPDESLPRLVEPRLGQ
ncbi:MAG TPA: hypothetical protein VI687_00700, partial [Candidatus Limnocylindrales bacterium]|nr:hypothetical protein [Candidatus Limnocylindrales bacterium]